MTRTRTHPGSTSDCAQGLCGASGLGSVNPAAVICDNKEAGSPCGSDLPATFVLTCGEIDDQIKSGARTPCAQVANDYSTAYKQCCGTSSGSSTSGSSTSVMIIGIAAGAGVVLCFCGLGVIIAAVKLFKSPIKTRVEPDVENSGARVSGRAASCEAERACVNCVASKHSFRHL